MTTGRILMYAGPLWPGRRQWRHLTRCTTLAICARVRVRPTRRAGEAPKHRRIRRLGREKPEEQKEGRATVVHFIDALEGIPVGSVLRRPGLRGKRRSNAWASRWMAQDRRSKATTATLYNVTAGVGTVGTVQISVDSDEAARSTQNTDRSVSKAYDRDLWSCDRGSGTCQRVNSGTEILRNDGGRGARDG